MAADPDVKELRVAAVDDALSAWRQGDCVLGEHWFVHRVDPSLDLTDGARAAAEAGTELTETRVRGLVVVTQSCDIVRKCADRPFVDVSPLVELDEDDFLMVERALVLPGGRFTRVEGQVAELGEMTARDYLESDPLDLDHLSSSA